MLASRVGKQVKMHESVFDQAEVLVDGHFQPSLLLRDFTVVHDCPFHILYVSRRMKQAAMGSRAKSRAKAFYIFYLNRFAYAVYIPSYEGSQKWTIVRKSTSIISEQEPPVARV